MVGPTRISYQIEVKREAELSQCRSKVVPQTLLRAKDHHADFVLLGSASSKKPVVEDGHKTDKSLDSKKLFYSTYSVPLWRININE